MSSGCYYESRVTQVTQLSPANTHAPSLAFWLANTTELLHFLESDKHVHSYATEAQGILTQGVRASFHQLVRLLEQELGLVIPHMMAEDATSDTKSCAGQSQGQIKMMMCALYIEQ